MPGLLGTVAPVFHGLDHQVTAGARMAHSSSCYYYPFIASDVAICRYAYDDTTRYHSYCIAVAVAVAAVAAVGAVAAVAAAIAAVAAAVVVEVLLLLLLFLLWLLLLLLIVVVNCCC